MSLEEKYRETRKQRYWTEGQVCAISQQPQRKA